MDKYVKLRVYILKHFNGPDWHWHGKLDGSMIVRNVKTGEAYYFERIE